MKTFQVINIIFFLLLGSVQAAFASHMHCKELWLIQTRISDQSFEIQFVFNQPKYSPGDTAFFKGYLVIRKSSFIREKKIINLKLIDSKDNEILHYRLLFENGLCNGQIILPDRINAGIYRLIGYADGIIPDQEHASFLYRSNLVVVEDKELKMQEGESFSKIQSSHGRTDSTNNSVFVGPTTLRMTVDFDKTVYKPREAVRVSVTLKDEEGRPVKANLAVSVVQDSLFRDHDHASRIQCSICNDDSTVRYNQVVSSKKIYPYYFKGRVVMENKQPVPDSTFVTFYLSVSDFIYGIYLTKAGEIEFPLFKNFDDDEVFYRISNHQKELKEAKLILDDLPYPGGTTSFTVLNSADPYGAFSGNKKIIVRSYSFYKNQKKETKHSDTDSEIDIDYVVDLRKFESFPSISEVLGNIVQAVKYRPSKEDPGVRVLLKEQGYYATENPVYIIDGIMTDNTDYFLSLNPASVLKIGVIRSLSKLSRYGLIGINGILVVETNIPNHAAVMPRTERSVRVTPVSEALEFKLRKNWNSLTPDIRTTLYWDPHVLTGTDSDSKINFTTADATGSFCIMIEGFTENAYPVFYKKNFTVAYLPSLK